ncbi:hypothetical protein OKW42_003297 [Paraburkholderia sp. WC7.3d]
MEQCEGQLIQLHGRRQRNANTGAMVVLSCLEWHRYAVFGNQKPICCTDQQALSGSGPSIRVDQTPLIERCRLRPLPVRGWDQFGTPLVLRDGWYSECIGYAFERISRIQKIALCDHLVG